MNKGRKWYYPEDEEGLKWWRNNQYAPKTKFFIEAYFNMEAVADMIAMAIEAIENRTQIV